MVLGYDSLDQGGNLMKIPTGIKSDEETSGPGIGKDVADFSYAPQPMLDVSLERL
jgi:hypothetical protein